MGRGLRFIGQEQVDPNNAAPVQERPSSGLRFIGSGKQAVTPEEVPTALFGADLANQSFEDFDFYVTSEMNPEEIRARRQSTGEKWANASVKMVGLAGTTFLDGTVGTVMGLGNAMFGDAEQGDALDRFIHNDFSEAIHKTTEQMEEMFPNYRTRYENESPWYQRMAGKGAANFWSDTIFKNFGFAIGAFGSGMATGAGFAKTLGTKAIRKSLARKLAKSMPGKSEAQIMEKMAKGQIDASKLLGELKRDAKALKWRDNVTEIGSSTLGAVGESRIEAIGAYHETYDRLMRENPGMTEAEADRMSKVASNLVFATDMATLSMGNYAQFRNAFSRGYNVNNSALNTIRKNAKTGLYETIGGKKQLLKDGASLLKSPLVEGFEEQQQFFNQKFSENYAALANDEKARTTIDTVMQAAGTAMAESYGDINSYENFFAGFVTGGVGMPNMQNGKYEHAGGIPGDVVAAMRRRKSTAAAIEQVNKHVQSPEYQDRVKFLARDLALEDIKQAANTNGDIFNFKNAESDQLVNMTLAFERAGKLEDLLDDVGKMSGMEAEDYRQAMKVKREALPEGIRQTLPESQEEYDIFYDKTNEDLKSMLTERSSKMQDQIKKIVEVKNMVEKKAGGRVPQELLDSIVHKAVTIENTEARIAELRPVVDALPLEVADTLADDAGDGQGTQPGKGQVPGVHMWDLSQLNETSEKQFIAAFNEYAKKNPYKASLVEEQVHDIVKLNQRRREFIDAYTDAFQHGKPTKQAYEELAKRIADTEKLYKESRLEDYVPGTRVIIDEETDDNEWIVSTKKKNGDYKLRNLATDKTRTVTADELLDLPIVNLGETSFTIDPNQVNNEKREMVEKTGKGAPNVYNDGKAEKLITHHLKSNYNLAAAVKVLNKVLGGNTRGRLDKVQMKRIKDLFYQGFVKHVWTQKEALAAISEFENISNIHVSAQLIALFKNRADTLKEMQEKIIEEYTYALDFEYQERNIVEMRLENLMKKLNITREETAALFKEGKATLSMVQYAIQELKDSRTEATAITEKLEKDIANELSKYEKVLKRIARLEQLRDVAKEDKGTVTLKKMLKSLERAVPHYIDQEDAVGLVEVLPEDPSLEELTMIQKALKEMLDDNKKTLEATNQIVKDITNEIERLEQMAEVFREHVKKHPEDEAFTLEDIKIGGLKRLRNQLLNEMGQTQRTIDQLAIDLFDATELQTKKDLQEEIDLLRGARDLIERRDAEIKAAAVAAEESEDSETSDVDDADPNDPGNSEDGPFASSEGSDLVDDHAGYNSRKRSPFNFHEGTTGSALPNGKPNKFRAQRRWGAWLQFKGVNKDDKLRVFRPGDPGFIIDSDELEAFLEHEEYSGSGLYAALVDADGNFYNANGGVTEKFSKESSLFTSLGEATDSTPAYGPKYHSVKDLDDAQLDAKFPHLKDSPREDKLRAAQVAKDDHNRDWDAYRRELIADIQLGKRVYLDNKGISRGVEQRDHSENVSPKLFFAESYAENKDNLEVWVSTTGRVQVDGTVHKVPEGYTYVKDKKTGNFTTLFSRKLVGTEIDTIVNIFGLIAQRHVITDDGQVAEPLRAELGYIEHKDGGRYDTSEQNLFRVLKGLAFFTDNQNFNPKTGQEINKNKDTAFHFVAGSNVPGGQVQLGSYGRIDLLDQKAVNDGKAVINPELVDTLQKFLSQRHRQISSFHLKKSAEGHEQLYIHGIDENGKVAEGGVYYGAYKDYILDQPDDTDPVVSIKMAPQSTPRTAEEFEEATINFANKYVRFHIPAKGFDEGSNDSDNEGPDAPPAPTTDDDQVVPTEDYIDDDPWGGWDGELGGLAITSATGGKMGQKSDDEGSDAFRRATGRTRPIENRAKAEKWFNKRFPGVDFKKVDEIANGKVWGKFSEAAVYIAKNAEEGTTYHEAFHVVFNLYLDKSEQDALVSEFKGRKDAAQQLSRYKTEYFDKSEREQIEEALADEFMEYELSEGKMDIPKSEPVKLTLFQKLLKLLGLFRQPSTIAEVYDRLSRGAYAGKPHVTTYKGTKDRRMPSKSDGWAAEVNGVMNAHFFKYMFKPENRDAFYAMMDGAPSPALIDRAYAQIRRDLVKNRQRIDSSLAEAQSDRNKAEALLTGATRSKNEKAMSKYAIESRQTEQRVAKLRDRLFELEYILNNFQENIEQGYPTGDIRRAKFSIRGMHSEHLKKFDLELVDFDTVKDGEAKDSGSNTWAYNASKVSPVKSSSKRMRMLLAGLPNTQKGTEKRVLFNQTIGVPESADFKETFSSLSNLLSGARSMEEMLIRLKGATTLIPGTHYLLDYLRMEDVIKGEVMSESDMLLATEFFQTFAKQKVNYRMGFMNGAGNSRTINASAETLIKTIRRKWEANASLIATPGSRFSMLYELDPVTREYKYKPDGPWSSFDFDYLGAGLDEGPAKLGRIDFLQALGVAFDPYILQQLSKDVTAAKNSTLLDLERLTFWRKLINVPGVRDADGNFVKRDVEGLDPINSIYNPDISEGPQVAEMVSAYVDMVPDIVENSHKNLNGDLVFDNIQNNYMSSMINILNNLRTIDPTENAHKLLMTKYPHLDAKFLQNSIILKKGGVLFDKDGNRTKTDANLFIFEGYSADRGRARKAFDQMAPADKLKAMLDGALDGNTVMLRAADNKNERYLNFGNVIRDKSYFDILTGYVADELHFLNSIFTSYERAPINASKMLDFDTAIAQSTLLSILAEDADFRATLKSHFDPSQVIRGKSFNIFNKNVDKFVKKKAGTIKSILEESLDKSVNKHMDYAEQLALVSEQGEDGYRMNFGIGTAAASMTEAEFRAKMKRGIINFHVGMLEQSKLFYGHPAYFKNMDNMLKRMAGAVGPKSLSIIDNGYSQFLHNSVFDMKLTKRLYKKAEGGKLSLLLAPEEDAKPVLRTAIFQDINVRTSQKYIRKNFPGDYDSMDEADAQGIIDLEYYRDFKLRNGIWSEKQEKLFQWEMRDRLFPDATYTWNGKTKTITERDLYDSVGNRIVFNPLKPQYFGPLAEEGFVTGMYKLSMYPLLPSLAEGRNLQHLMTSMRAKNIGLATFGSASKGENMGKVENGSAKLQEMYIDGEFNSGALETQDTWYEFWGVQVSTGDTRKDKVTNATQVAKQVISGLYADGTYLPLNSLAKEGQSGEDATKAILEEYIELNSRRIEMGKKSLMRRLGIEKSGEDYVVRDTARMLSSLKREAEKRDLPNAFFDAIDNLVKEDGTLQDMGVAAHSFRNVFEPMLTSIADSLTIGRKRHGANMIQAAGSMFEDIDTVRKFKEVVTEKGVSKVLDSGSLEFYQNKKGVVTSMEVYLPHWFKDVLEGQITKDGDNFILNGKGGPLDSRLFNILGFRIPTSGLNSIESIIVKDFLPQAAGDMIVLPSEIVAKAGSDYDVDKMSLYIPNYEVKTRLDKNGNEEVTSIAYSEYYTQEQIDEDPDIAKALYDRVKFDIAKDNPELYDQVKDLRLEKKRRFKNVNKISKGSIVGRFKVREGFTALTGDISVKSIDENGNEVVKQIKAFDIDNVDLKNAKDKKALEQLMALALNETRILSDLTNELQTKDDQTVSENMLPLFPDAYMEDLVKEVDTVGEMKQIIAARLQILRTLRQAMVKKDPKTHKNIEERIDAVWLKTREMLDEWRKEVDDLIEPHVKPIFDEMSLAEKNGHAAIENRTIELMTSIVTAPENFQNLLTPISTEGLEEEADYMLELRGVDTTPPTFKNMLDMKYLVEAAERYLNGLSGVGISAVQSTSNILANLSDLEIALQSNVMYESPFDVNQYGDMIPRKLRTMVNLNHAKGYGSPPRLNNRVTQAGEDIGDIFNQFINAYVDVATNPFIIDLNAGPDTAPVIMMLIRMGVPKRDAFLFMNQPIIREILEDRVTFNSSLVAKSNDTLKKGYKAIHGSIIAKYTKPSEGAREARPSSNIRFTQERLEAGIKDLGSDSLPHRMDQLRIMQDFLRYEAMATEMRNMSQSANQDTAGYGRSEGELFLGMLKPKRFQESGFITNFANMFSEGSFLGPYKEAVDGLLDVYKPLLPLSKDSAFKHLATEFSGILLNDKFKSNSARVSLLEKFSYNFIYHMVSGVDIVLPGSNKIHNLEHDVLHLMMSHKDRPSTVAEFAKLQKELSTNRKSKNPIANMTHLKKNKVFKYLIPYVEGEGGLDTIIMNQQSMDNEEIDGFISDWEDLLKDPLTKNLAIDLAKVAILETGFRKHPYGFTHLIPPSLFSDIVEAGVRKFNNDPTNDKDDFMLKFFEDEYSDSDLMPYVSFTSMPFYKTSVERPFSGDLERDRVIRSRGKSAIYKPVPKVAASKGFRFDLMSPTLSKLLDNPKTTFMPRSLSRGRKLLKLYHTDPRELGLTEFKDISLTTSSSADIDLSKQSAWAKTNPNGYEVSSRGDAAFSALNARLNDGRTVEEAYQLDVKGYRAEIEEKLAVDPDTKFTFGKNTYRLDNANTQWLYGKAKQPRNITREALYESYKGLWKQWAAENPTKMNQLAEKSRGKVLTDMFAKQSPDSINQARALSEILNETILNQESAVKRGTEDGTAEENC